MEKPLEITFHQMEPSPAIEARVREKAALLERFAERITSCRVVIEKDHRHHQKGNLYRVRLDIGVPGRELAVSRKGPRIMLTRMSTSRSATPSGRRSASSRTTSASAVARSRRTRCRRMAACA